MADAEAVSRVVDRMPRPLLRQLLLLLPVLLDVAVRTATGSLGSAGWFYATGLALLALVTAAAATGFARPLPVLAATGFAVADLAAIGLLRLVPDGTGIGVLAVLPAMWLAADHRLRGVGITVAAVAALISLPGVVYDGVAVDTWSRALMIPVVAAMCAITVAGTTELWARQNDQLASQGRRLQEALDEVTAALSVKDDFVASVSHELRTPLTSILGYLEILLAGESLDPSVRRQLGIVRRNGERLLRLVSDLLLSAQVHEGQLSLDARAVDLTEVVEQAVEELSERTENAGVGMRSELERAITVQGDPLRLRQVVDNLLSNAVKYTDRGGTVDVTLRRRAGDVELVVSDTGIGIAADDLEQLFTRFFRARDVQDRAIQGVGLGLAISRAVVEAHRGSIDVRSTPGAGTTFVVRLPALAASIENHGARVAPPASRAVRAGAAVHRLPPG